MACLMPNSCQFFNSFDLVFCCRLFVRYSKPIRGENERARFSFFGADGVKTGTEFEFNMATEKASFDSFVIYT